MLNQEITLTPDLSDSDHYYFSHNSELVLVEYGDYQCEHCRDFSGVISQILQQNKNDINFVFRHFPMKQQHDFAVLAAEAAEASGAQGKYWEMHTALYENQSKFAFGFFEELAQDLNLDMNKFESDLSDHVHQDKINADFNSGIRSGVNGTPSLFINGRRFLGDKSLDNLNQVIQSELQPFST